MPVIDAPPTPIVSIGPGARYLALVLRARRAVPADAVSPARHSLSSPGLGTAPRLGSRRRLRRAGGLSVLRVSDGTERYLSLPDGAQVGAPVWAADGRRFAFTID